MSWRFIHIPKCGGMSFRKAFQDLERELLPTHDPAWMLPAGPTVAVMRHPLDRLCSIHAHHYGGMDGFREWLDGDEWRCKPVLNVDKQGDRRKLALSLPQSEWLREDTHIIRFEHYQADLDAWCDLAGYPRRQLEQRNASNRRPGWTAYLREDQMVRFREYYAADYSRRAD